VFVNSAARERRPDVSRTIIRAGSSTCAKMRRWERFLARGFEIFLLADIADTAMTSQPNSP